MNIKSRSDRYLSANSQKHLAVESSGKYRGDMEPLYVVLITLVFLGATAFRVHQVYLQTQIIAVRLEHTLLRLQQQTDVLNALRNEAEKGNKLTCQLLRAYGHEPEA